LVFSNFLFFYFNLKGAIKPFYTRPIYSAKAFSGLFVTYKGKNSSSSPNEV